MNRIFLGWILCVVVVIGCTANLSQRPPTRDSGVNSTVDADSSSSTTIDSYKPIPKETIHASQWIEGPLSEDRIPYPDLLALPGKASGPPLVMSNNPETFVSQGWLLQTSRNDPKRGGAPYSLQGTFPLFFFHVNKAAGGLFFHVVVTNASANPVTVSMRGSMHTNTEYPCDPASGSLGQSYRVARDWLEDTLPIKYKATTLAAHESAQIAWTKMRESSMVDGLMEITSDGPVYVHTVATAVNDPLAAVDVARKGSPAAGEIVSPSENEFGRQAGVYEHSKWLADFRMELPQNPSHLGMFFITNGKFLNDDIYPQDQTAKALMHLSDSAERTYGNYGWHYHLKITFDNPTDAEQSVVVKFSHQVRNANLKSSTWNSAVKIDGQRILNILTWPWDPVVQLATVPVPAKGTAPLDIELWVPGLIFNGAQLLFERR